MERLESMKECLMSVVQGQMANLNQVDTQELGAAVDMLKDLEEAMYYCTITKAMKKEEDGERKINYYHDRDRDLDRDMGRMYYSSSSYPSSYSSSSRNYQEQEYEVPFNMRDSREGRAPQSRRMYMESKELHKDQPQKMKDLEKYMQDLGQDIFEMIEDASPEEKKTLEKKISALATKIAQLNA